MKQYLLTSLFALMATCAFADQKQSVVINGTTVDKTVKSISYQGTKALITYADGSSQTVDRSAFHIRFTNLDATAIARPKADRKHDGKCYTLSGKRIDKPVQRGTYVKDGKKIIKK